MIKTRVNHKDVQAIFRGFDKRWPNGRFFYCRFESRLAGYRLLQHIKEANGGHLTSYHDMEEYPSVCVNAAFTYWGLATLKLPPKILQSFPGEFIQGMKLRAKLNGDVDDSAPDEWEDTWSGNPGIHIWIGVYANSVAELDEWDKDLRTFIDEVSAEASKMKAREGEMPEGLYSGAFSSGVLHHLVKEHDFSEHGDSNSSPISIVGTQDVRRFWSSDDVPMHIDDPSTNPRRSVVLEHFGFRDGVSQPAVDGLEQDEEKIQSQVAGGGKLNKKGKWEPLATGEFLLGYQDELSEIPIAPVPPALAMNGSFMVQRKLYQDVDTFREYLVSQAAGMRNRHGESVTADYLAAKMIGRKRDGSSFYEGESLNDFRFADDMNGNRCPLGSHVRRANPRDSISMDPKVSRKFGSVLVNQHRILRRAITYGDPIPAGKKEAEINPDVGQGLMFITLQASISDQFEFVQQQWVNNGNDLNQGNDRDPVIGHQEGKGRMTIPGDGVNPTMICSNLPRFVKTRGGDYFFLPGVSAFNQIADGRFSEIDPDE